MCHVTRLLIPVALVAALSGCTGDTGPQGPTGPGQVLNFAWGFNYPSTGVIFPAGQCRNLNTTGVPSSTNQGDILVAGSISGTGTNPAGAEQLVILPGVSNAAGDVPMTVCNFTGASIDMSNTGANFNYRIVRP